MLQDMEPNRHHNNNTTWVRVLPNPRAMSHHPRDSSTRANNPHHKTWAHLHLNTSLDLLRHNLYHLTNP